MSVALRNGLFDTHIQFKPNYDRKYVDINQYHQCNDCPNRSIYFVVGVEIVYVQSKGNRGDGRKYRGHNTTSTEEFPSLNIGWTKKVNTGGGNQNERCQNKIL